MHELFPLIIRVWSLGFPKGAPPSLLRAMRLLTPLSVALWIAGVIGTWMPWSGRIVPDIRDGAVATLVMAFHCWSSAQRYDDDRRELIRLSADLYRRIPREDRPPRLAASGR